MKDNIFESVTFLNEKSFTKVDKKEIPKEFEKDVKTIFNKVSDYFRSLGMAGLINRKKSMKDSRGLARSIDKTEKQIDKTVANNLGVAKMKFNISMADEKSDRVASRLSSIISGCGFSYSNPRKVGFLKLLFTDEGSTYLYKAYSDSIACVIEFSIGYTTMYSNETGLTDCKIKMYCINLDSVGKHKLNLEENSRLLFESENEDVIIDLL